MNHENSIFRRIIISSICNTSSVIVPIQTSFYLAIFNNNLAIPSLLSTFMLISVFIFEIPSGYLADKYGNKRITIFGYVSELFGLIMFTITDKLLFFILAIILLGIGAAFISGTSYSYFISVCKSHDIDFEKVLVVDRKIGKIVSAIFMITSGILYGINMRLPYIINALILLFGAIVLILLPREIMNEDIIGSNFSNKTKNIINYLKSNKHMLLAVIVYTVLSRVLIINFGLYNNLFDKNNIRITWYGLLYAIFMFINIVGIKLYEKKLKNGCRLSLFLTLSLSFITILINSKVVLLFSIFIQEAMFAFINIDFDIQVYRSIPSEEVSSYYQSIVSFLSSIVAIVVGLIFSSLLYAFDTNTYYIFAGISLVLVLFILNNKQGVSDK